MRWFAILLTLLATPLLAHEYAAGRIQVDHPYAFPSTGPTAAGYLVVKNTGAADRLLAIEAGVPRVSLHRSILQDGIARMRPAQAIEVGKDETVTFEPGGLHVMFMGLAEPLVIGDEIPATLIFENAGKVEVLFYVEERPAGGAIDHSKINHD